MYISSSLKSRTLFKNSKSLIDSNKHMEKINNPVGNTPLPDNPFFFEPKVSNVTPMQNANFEIKKAPINSLGIKTGGSIDLFKIDFNKNKKNRKKVSLNI